MTDQLDELQKKLELQLIPQNPNNPNVWISIEDPADNYRSLVEVIRDLLNNADTNCGIDRATVYERVNLKIQELLK